MNKTTQQSAEEWVLEQVKERTDPDGDLGSNAESDTWTGRGRLKNDGNKFSTPYTGEQVDEAIDNLLESGELFRWFGLLTLADEEHLRAVVESEAQSDFGRQLLVAQVNERLSELEANA